MRNVEANLRVASGIVAHVSCPKLPCAPASGGILLFTKASAQGSYSDPPILAACFLPLAYGLCYFTRYRSRTRRKTTSGMRMIR